jgi:hypothetical protein
MFHILVYVGVVVGGGGVVQCSFRRHYYPKNAGLNGWLGNFQGRDRVAVKNMYFCNLFTLLEN